jgi:hypothetical protein
MTQLKNVLSHLKNSFSVKPHPKRGYIYAVTKGTYLGELLVYCKTMNESHGFLSMPKMINRVIPVEKFQFGLDNGIVDVVERLPRNIYDTCLRQYNKNNL